MPDKIEIASDEEFDDDSECTASEDERLLQAVQKRNRRVDDSDTELMPFADSDDSDNDANADDDDDDDDEDDLEQLLHDSDIEGAEDDDDELPDTTAWGKKRSTYYNADFVDKDYSSYNLEEEELAKDEEVEGKKSQLRIAQQTTEGDYQLDSDVEISDGDHEEEDCEADDAALAPEAEFKVKTDLGSLSASERMQILSKESPELLGLVQNFEQYLKELQDLLVPVLSYVKVHDEPMIPALQFAACYRGVLETYLTIVAFYLLGKVQRSIGKHHPVFKRLLQLKQQQSRLQPRYDAIIRPQLEALLERIVDKDSFKILPAMPTVSATTEALAGKKRAVVDMDIPGGDNEDEVADEDTRRGINYQISKNKGLVANRKGKKNNPRVKNRGKYEKAIIRRKGAVRKPQTEIKRYGGEHSGINARVTKSIKFKN